MTKFNKKWEDIFHNNQNCPFFLDNNIKSIYDLDKIQPLNFNQLNLNSNNSLNNKYYTNSDFVAFEKTSGTNLDKVIGFTQLGLNQFKDEISKLYIENVINKDKNKLLFATSFNRITPNTFINNIKIGLTDTDYFNNEVVNHFYQHQIINPNAFNLKTIQEFYYSIKSDLIANSNSIDFISLWSPSYLLSLLNNIDPKIIQNLNRPNLTIDLWTNSFAQNDYFQLKNILPQAKYNSKGLLLTEGIVTKPFNNYFIESKYNFIEYQNLLTGEILTLEYTIDNELYEVLLTTNNGLYRYKTNDLVTINTIDPQFNTKNITFVSKRRGVSDLAGEKLDLNTLEELNIDFTLIINSYSKTYTLIFDKNLSTDKEQSLLSHFYDSYHFNFALKFNQIDLKIIKLNDYINFVNTIELNKTSYSTTKKQKCYQIDKIKSLLTGSQYYENCFN